MGEAAKLLGYTTGHVYKLINDHQIVPSRRDPIRLTREDIIEFRDQPPKGKRPKIIGQHADDLTAQLADLCVRVERLERRLGESAGEDKPGAVDASWQRTAVAARTAVFRVCDVGHDYEEIVADYESVIQKQNEAAELLAAAREAHRKIVGRYREAIAAFVSPNDTDELNEWRSPKP